MITNAKNEDEICNSREEWYMYEVTGSKKKIKIPIHIFNELSKEISMQQGRTDKEESFYWDLVFSRISSKKPILVILEIIKFLSKIKYYSASQYTNPSDCPISFEAEKISLSIQHMRDPNGHRKFLCDMYLGYNDAERRRF